MANLVVRPVGYTGTLQEMTWQQGNNVPVTAYLWGGGGGGGGNDSNRGGYGGGGGYSRFDFTVNNGDVIGIAVGGGGGAGASGRSGAPGGSGGSSYVIDAIFNSRTATGTVPVIPYSNSAYCSFLNTYGVWINPVSATYFDNTYTVNFPTSGNYTITASCDNYGTVYLDGTAVLSVPDYHYTVQTTVYVTAGSHTVRLYGVNTGGPGSFGATIDGGDGYSGGRGGNAGGAGSSGGGGGGGGSTVVLVNDAVQGIAAGGGGGGGGGNAGAARGESAPGSRGQGTSSPGQNGQDKSGDGGGGGGGGGGLFGGNGGSVPGGDQGGYAGAYGLSSGSYENPADRSPGGTSNVYYRSGIATGGLNANPGTSGYAVFEFAVPGSYVHYNGSFAPVSKTWVNNNGVWTPVNSIYVKDGGVWNQVLGGTPPTFASVSGNFGVDSRPYS